MTTYVGDGMSCGTCWVAIAQEFTCNEEGAMQFTTSEAAAADLYPTTGYVTVRVSGPTGSTLHTYGDGSVGSVVFDTLAPLDYCVWSSDRYGTQSGYIENAFISGAASRWDISRLSQVQVLNFLTDASPSTIDTRPLLSLASLEVSGGGATSLLLPVPVQPTLYILSVPDSDLPSSDDIVNAMDASVPGGTLNIAGGTTPARTAASDDNYNALVANGWTVSTN